MAAITKKCVVAHLGAYAIVRGVVDAIRPADEMSEESAAYDKMTFDVCEASIAAKAGCGEGK